MKISIKWPEVRFSKRCASMTDPFEAMISMFGKQLVSDKSLKNEIPTWVDHLSEIRPLKCTSNLHFQILTPPRIKLICRLYFSSFCRDIHFQSCDYFTAFRHKLKFGKCYTGSEKTYIECTREVFLFVYLFLTPKFLPASK